MKQRDRRGVRAIMAAGRNPDNAMPTLFQRLLGASFDDLPPAVCALHSIRGRGRYRGRAQIERGTHLLANLCAAIAGLPHSAHDVVTIVEFTTDARGETWHRDFGGSPMVSRLSAHGDRLGERFGPMQFRFVLEARDGAIHWRTAGVRLFGMLPLPAAWFADVRCRERERAGRYEFLVEASLPWIGRLIRYEGWLEPA